MLELADNASWSANATCSANLETPALFHPTRVYVAIILSGLVATSKHNRSSGQMDARVWQSWATHVVDGEVKSARAMLRLSDGKKWKQEKMAQAAVTPFYMHLPKPPSPPKGKLKDSVIITRVVYIKPRDLQELH